MYPSASTRAKFDVWAYVIPVAKATYGSMKQYNDQKRFIKFSETESFWKHFIKMRLIPQEK
jgi:hypothetical protein